MKGPTLDEERLRAVFAPSRRTPSTIAVFRAVALGLHGIARATADLDPFIRATEDNIERLKSALRSVFRDSNIDEISATDLCGE